MDPGPLHTLSVGTAGPRVAFLHGLFGQGRNWSTIAKALAGPDGDRARCTLVDLPDHGRSPWSETFSFEAYAASVADTLRAIDPGPVGRRRPLARWQDRHGARPDRADAGVPARRGRHRAQGLRRPRAVQRLHLRDEGPAAGRAGRTGPTPRRVSTSPTPGSRGSCCRTCAARAPRGGGRPTSSCSRPTLRGGAARSSPTGPCVRVRSSRMPARPLDRGLGVELRPGRGRRDDAGVLPQGAPADGQGGLALGAHGCTPDRRRGPATRHRPGRLSPHLC